MAGGCGGTWGTMLRDVGAAQHGARAARGARGTPKTPPRDTQKTPEGHAGHSWDSKRTQSTTVTPSGHPTTSRAPGGHLRHSGTVYGTPVGHSVDTKVIQGTPRGAQNSQMIPMPPSPVAAPSLPSPAGVGSPGPGAWGREHARGEPPQTIPGAVPKCAQGVSPPLEAHVDALLLQQLPLRQVPVWRGPGGRPPFPLSPRLLRVREAEHVVLPQNEAVAWLGRGHREI